MFTAITLYLLSRILLAKDLQYGIGWTFSIFLSMLFGLLEDAAFITFLCK